MSNKVFGVELETLVQKQRVDVPRVVLHTIDYLNKQNAHLEEGLFRIPGNTVKIGLLKKHFDSDNNIDLFKQKDLDVHTVACLLKMYLRELPTPAIIPRFYSTFMKVYQNPDPKQRLVNFRKLVLGLPKSHRFLLLTVLSYLNKVAQNQATNKMSTLNLALIFAPNLMRSEKETLASIMEDADKVAGSLQLLIQEVDYLTTGNSPAWFATAGGSPLLRAKSVSSPALPNARTLPREDSISDVFINSLSSNSDNSYRPALGMTPETTQSTAPEIQAAASSSSTTPSTSSHVAAVVPSNEPKEVTPAAETSSVSTGGTTVSVGEQTLRSPVSVVAAPCNNGEDTPPPSRKEENASASAGGGGQSSSSAIKKVVSKKEFSSEGTRSSLTSSLDNEDAIGTAPRRSFSFIRSSSDTKLNLLEGPDERVIATSVKNMKALRASSDFTHHDKNRRRLELMNEGVKNHGFMSHQDLKSFAVMD